MEELAQTGQEEKDKLLSQIDQLTLNHTTIIKKHKLETETNLTHTQAEWQAKHDSELAKKDTEIQHALTNTNKTVDQIS